MERARGAPRRGGEIAYRGCAWAALFTEAACGAPRQADDDGRDSIHAQTNTLLVQVAADRIHGLTNVVFGSHRAGEAQSARFTGYDDYHDVFVRTAEGWRFESRRACSHLADPLPPEFL